MAQAVNKNDPEVARLVQKAAAGDGVAFGQIYELYFEKIYRFIFFRVNHQETTEDLVSETFVRVWDKLGQINEVEAFSGWLYQIARNLVIDYYRAKKPDIDLLNLENTLEYEENVVDVVNLGFEQAQLLTNLKKLSPDQQVVIKLKFLDELENKEVAQILGKSEGAIRVIQHRAIAELKKLLNDHE